jgi:hypothetical protein
MPQFEIVGLLGVRRPGAALVTRGARRYIYTPLGGFSSDILK